MTTALAKEDTREIVLKHALEELKAFRAKYSTLSELSELFKDIDKLLLATNQERKENNDI